MKNVGVKNSRGQFNISFGLIFAMIAGAFILFLAIYAVIKFTSIETTKIEGEESKTILVLMNPLESSFESSRTVTIHTPTEMKIYAGCYFEEPRPDDPMITTKEYFGRQLLNTSRQVHGKWINATMNVGSSNKYIFSENPSQGRKFYIFSKQFEFPYKVGDLIYILSEDKEYCFVDSDTVRNGDLEEEIENLNQPMLHVVDEIEDCTGNNITVCFREHTGCDIRVDYSRGLLRKEGATMEFEEDALMFAAIFSDEETYNCQVNRLMQRAESLSKIYLKKSDLMVEQARCSQEVKPNLLIFSALLKNYEDLSDLKTLETVSYTLNIVNQRSQCSLW